MVQNKNNKIYNGHEDTRRSRYPEDQEDEQVPREEEQVEVSVQASSMMDMFIYHQCQHHHLTFPPSLLNTNIGRQPGSSHAHTLDLIDEALSIIESPDDFELDDGPFNVTRTTAQRIDRNSNFAKQ